MVNTLRLSFVLFVLTLTSASLVQAQSQNDQSLLNFDSGLGGTYFVDEAGIGRIQEVSPLDEFIDPEHYLLGPFDVISLHGTGLNEFSYRALVINASGDIITPIAGKISLKGLTLADAKKVISEHFTNYFKDTQVSLTLDAPRPVNIHLGGDIPNPGRYVIPAGTRYDAIVNGFYIDNQLFAPLTNSSISRATQINTSRPSVSGIDFDKMRSRKQQGDDEANSLVNALDKKYDLRMVKVTKRDGRVQYVDLKAYFNSGDTQFAPYIQDGDQVTMIGNSSSRALISISGAVNEAFSGSYRTDDTLEKLITIAGGYLPEADSSNVILIRETGVSIDKKTVAISEIKEVKPGDQFIIPFKESPSKKGTIQLFGEVSIPGMFPILSGETPLADVLEMADGITDEALANGAYLIREPREENGIPELQNSNLVMLSKSSDQFIEGLDYLELEETLSPNRMPLDLTNAEVVSSLKLNNGDRIYVPEDQHTVTLLGQVSNPGYYQFSSTLSAKDYIKMAGGMTVAASTDRVYVIKAGSNTWFKPTDTTVQSGDIIFVDRIPFEDVSTGRTYQLNLQRLKTDRTRLILTAVSAVTSIVTAYVAVARLNQ